MYRISGISISRDVAVFCVRFRVSGSCLKVTIEVIVGSGSRDCILWHVIYLSIAQPLFLLGNSWVIGIQLSRAHIRINGVVAGLQVR